jgi:hypothetical protein
MTSVGKDDFKGGQIFSGDSWWTGIIDRINVMGELTSK